MMTMFIDYNHYLLSDFQVNPHSVTADNYETTAVFTAGIYSKCWTCTFKKKHKLCLSNSDFELTNNNVVLLL